MLPLAMFHVMVSKENPSPENAPITRKMENFNSICSSWHEGKRAK